MFFARRSTADAALVATVAQNLRMVESGEPEEEPLEPVPTEELLAIEGGPGHDAIVASGPHEEPAGALPADLRPDEIAAQVAGEDSEDSPAMANSAAAEPAEADDDLLEVEVEEPVAPSAAPASVPASNDEARHRGPPRAGAGRSIGDAAKPRIVPVAGRGGALRHHTGVRRGAVRVRSRDRAHRRGDWSLRHGAGAGGGFGCGSCRPRVRRSACPG